MTKKIIQILFLFTVLLLIVCSNKDIPAVHTAVQTTAVVNAPTPQPQTHALELSLSKDVFFAGKQATLDLKVSCAEPIHEDVSVLDETGAPVAVLHGNGSAVLSAQIPFIRHAVGGGSLTAVCGTLKSASVPYSVQQEVTAQMIESLYDVSQDLGNFALSSGFDDPYGEKAVARVKEFLCGHAQIESVTENNGVVFYRTRDGLTGSYGMGLETEGYAGYAPAREVYADWKNGASVADALIQSDVALTSDRCIILCPEAATETEMRAQAEFSYEAMRTVFSSADLYMDEQARSCLADGSFTDCGMLIIDAHGRTIKRPDGSSMLFFLAGRMSTRDECVAYLQSIDPQMLYTSILNADSSCCAALDVSLTENGIDTTLRLSTIFLDHALEGKTFDNTVVYLCVCHAFSDTHLLDLLTSHGASMIIGCHVSMMLDYSTLVLHEIHSALVREEDDTSYGPFIRGIASVDAESVDRLLKVNQCSEEDLQLIKMHVQGNLENPRPDDDSFTLYFDIYKKLYRHYYESVDANAVPSYAVRDDLNKLRTYQDECSLKGHAVTKEGLPAAGAMVTAYRWLDHSWQEYEHKSVVDANGEYSFSALPYGIYALEATLSGMSCHITMEVNEANAQAEPITLSGGVVLLGQIDYHPADTQSSTDNYSSLLVSPKVLKAPDASTQEKLDGHLANHYRVMDGQVSMLRGTPAGAHNNPSFATQYLTRAYSAGDVLSLQLDALTYMNGAQRPWHGGGSLNIELSTGEFISPDHLLIDFSHAPNLRAGIMQLLDRFSDSDLSASRETLCERTLRGELGGWALTPDGLEISYSTYDFGRYAAVGSTVIPYDVLIGEINDMYLPKMQQDAKQSEIAVRTVSNTDPRFRDAAYQVWGAETGRAMAFEGAAEHVYVYACNPDDPQKTTSIVFYASSLSNALIHLPVHDGNLYRVDWQDGSVRSSTTLQYP